MGRGKNRLRPDDAAIMCLKVDSFEYQDIGHRDAYSALNEDGAICWCGLPSLEWYPKAIDVVLLREPTQAIVQPFDTGPLVVRRDLFQLLRPFLSTQVVGNVLIQEPTGRRVSKECVTLYDTTPHDVRVFGSEKKRYFCCPDCGRTMGGIEYGPAWMTRKQREGWDVAFFSVTLLITPRVAENVRWQEFPTLRPSAIRFRD